MKHLIVYDSIIFKEMKVFWVENWKFVVNFSNRLILLRACYFTCTHEKCYQLEEALMGIIKKNIYIFTSLIYSKQQCSPWVIPYYYIWMTTICLLSYNIHALTTSYTFTSPWRTKVWLYCDQLSYNILCLCHFSPSV